MTQTTADAPAFVDLLGTSRAAIVEVLQAGPHSVAELAARLELSEVAIRRHLQVLERDGLVDATTVRRNGRGRPSAEYALTERGQRLFPDRSAEFANELLTYLEQSHGRSALLEFFRWRQERQGERYAEAIASAAPSDRREAVETLAELLNEDGFLAEVAEVDDGEGRTQLQLRQGHCAIREIAEQHPEVCAYEAALFQRLLGTGLSRRETIANGSTQCVCNIQ